MSTPSATSVPGPAGEAGSPEGRLLDEVAASLRLVRSPATASMVLGRVNDLVQATGRTGAAAAGLRAAYVPPELSVAVIVWSDLSDDAPTVIAHRSPVRLARMLAETLYEQLHEGPGFDGAAAFLDEHPAPADWTWPEDVDGWLEALRTATAYPAFSFHQIPVAGGTDGTHQTVVRRLLADLLHTREQALQPEVAPSPARAAGRHAAGHDVGGPYLAGVPTPAE